jgi:hypothetical protein
MINNRDINIRMIIDVAKRLGDLRDDEFLDSIPGHLSPDRAGQARLPLLIKRLGEIAEWS